MMRSIVSLANQRNIQILDVEHEKIRDSCQALFQPMPKLEEGLILRLIRREKLMNDFQHIISIANKYA